MWQTAEQLFLCCFFLTENSAGAEKIHVVDTCKSKQNRAKAQAQAFARFCTHAVVNTILSTLTDGACSRVSKY